MPSGSEPFPEARRFYASHSAVTDPGQHAGLLAALPGDLPTLARVAGGLVTHFFAAAHVFKHTVPPERLGEVDLRGVGAMLARLRELDDRPLEAPRPLDRRLVGCCRDFAVLLCAMARQHGIPARLRVGFAGYFLPGSHEDHAVCEVWDRGEGRWRLVDPQLDEAHRAHYRIAFDPLDVPRDGLLVAGQAWQACRRGAADPSTFGVGVPGAPRGWPFLQSRLLLDLAALDKREMLQWDGWSLGALPQETGAALLDEVAQLTLTPDAAFPRLQALGVEHPALRVPAVVRSFSPAVGAHDVVLA